MLVTRKDGTRHIRCADKDWKVREVFDWTTEAEPDRLYMTAAWEPTWQALSTLTEASKAIDDFESEQALHVVADFDGLHRTYTSGELSLEWPAEPKFAPKANVDYAPALLRMINAADSVAGKGRGGELRPFVQRCMSLAVKRALRIRAALVTMSGGRRLLDFERGEKLDSALMYIFGTVKPRACDGCAKSLGVYTCCVTMPGHALGACANCVYEGRRRSCNYHREPLPSVVRYSAAGHILQHAGPDEYNISEDLQHPGNAAESIEAEDPEYFDPDAGADDVPEDAKDPDYTESGMIQSSPPSGPPNLRRSRSSWVVAPNNEIFGSCLQFTPPRMALKRLISPLMNKRAGGLDLQRSASKRRRQSEGARSEENSVSEEENSSSQQQHNTFRGRQSPTRATTSQLNQPGEVEKANSSARAQLPPGPAEGQPPTSPLAVPVFRHQRFAPGQAAPGQVKYIISVSDPRNRRRMDVYWRKWLDKREQEGSQPGYSCQLEFLSDCCEEALNDAVDRCCPPQPLPPGVAAGTREDAIVID